MMNYKAICFDFDYTLADCTDSIVDGFHYAFEKLGHTELPSREAVRLTVGQMLEDAYTNLSGVTDPVQVAKFRPLFIECAAERQREETVLLPGGEGLLKALHQQGIKLAIVSSKRGDTIAYIMNRLGLGDCMGCILGSEHVTAHKPDPQGIFVAMKELGVEPSEVLFCGDTVIDAEAAQRAGVDFCAVLNGTTTAEAFVDFPHVAICQDLFALGQMLGTDIQNISKN